MTEPATISPCTITMDHDAIICFMTDRLTRGPPLGSRRVRGAAGATRGDHRPEYRYMTQVCKPHLAPSDLRRAISYAVGGVDGDGPGRPGSETGPPLEPRAGAQRGSRGGRVALRLGRRCNSLRRLQCVGKRSMGHVLGPKKEFFQFAATIPSRAATVGRWIWELASGSGEPSFNHRSLS